MMLSYSRARIYVSFAAVESKRRGQATFQRIEYVWLITVQPYRIQFPGGSECSDDPIHLHVYWDEHDQAFQVEPDWQKGDSSKIRGTILVAHQAKASHEQIHSILSDCFRMILPEQGSNSLLAKDPNRRLRQSLRVLQDEGILEKFDVADFMAYALVYTSRRMRFEVAPVVVYNQLNGHNERRKSSQTNLMPSRTQSTQNVYGGLM